jgi:serralysin
MPAVTRTDPAGNPYVDGILSGVEWATQSFSFSFPSSGSYYGASYGDGEPLNNFGALSAVQKAVVRTVLSTYSSVANLQFTEVAETSTQHADLRLALSDSPSTAWAYYPTTLPEGGDAWFNKSGGAYSQPKKGNYAYVTFLHEIGHALGLDHAHESPAMPQDRDSMEYTVMSYRSYVGASPTGGYTNETGGYAQSLMMYDVAAVQHMYGANYASNSGNTTYKWSASTGEMFINGVGQSAPSANRIFQTIWDGGGSDTYDFSTYASGLRVDLRPGEWSTTAAAQLARLTWNGSELADGNIANSLLYNGDVRSLVENAIGGTGNDVLIGNDTANVLRGGAADDLLVGSGGNDALYGDAGFDAAMFTGSRSYYQVSLQQDGSFSVRDLRAGSPDGLDALYSVEWLTFLDESFATSGAAEPNSFENATLAIRQFGAGAGGWTTNAAFPRQLADVDGDGRDDIVGFGDSGAWVSLAASDGSFGGLSLAVSNFGRVAGGWASRDQYPRLLGDVNGDGRADIVGFGGSGAFVSLATGGGAFEAPTLWVSNFGSNAGGWTSDTNLPRRLADVNGDGFQDVIGFGDSGAWVSLATGSNSFTGPSLWSSYFGRVAGGWSSDDAYHREVADVNGDGLADIVGFGASGAWVALATGQNSFGGPSLWLGEMGTSDGWASQSSTPRMLADANGDGRADIVGLAGSQAVVALSTGSAFASPEVWANSADFGGNFSRNPIQIADITGDDAADLVVFRDDGAWTYHSTFDLVA